MDDEFILYLQPAAQTPLFQAIQAFFKESQLEWGPNEAHQYHPHVSLTGFWSMSPKIFGDFSLEKIEALIPLKPKIVVTDPVLIQNDQTLTSNLILPVETDLSQFPVSLKELNLPGCESIRIKKVNHISLGYGQGFTQSLKQLEMARDRMSVDILKCHQWEIVFYKRIKKGASLNDSHEFVEIAKWNLINHIDS